MLLLLEALSWSMFLSCSRSRETGWSRTVKVHPSFSSWSSSRFCCSLRGFCSGPMDHCAGRRDTLWRIWSSLYRRTTKHPPRWTSCWDHSDAPSCSSLSWWSAGIRQTGTGRRLSVLHSLAVNQKQMVWDFLKPPNHRACKTCCCVHLWAPVSLRAADFCEKWDSPEWQPSRDASNSEREAVSQEWRKHFHFLICKLILKHNVQKLKYELRTRCTEKHEYCVLAF